MRASPFFAAVLPLALTGCLQAVDIGAPDGNALAGLDASTLAPDASLFLPDAAVLPGDAGTMACQSANECPPVVQTDPICNPVRSICEGGKCSTERVPRVWDSNPGACQKAAECDCQELAHDKCLGSFLCTAGKCEWKCGGCTSDLECPLGEVCQEVSCGEPKQCIAGCRDGAGCPDKTLCDDFVYGKCGEPYGQCQPEPSCTTDSDCPQGTICDFALGGGSAKKVCQTGCHDAAQCAADEECLYDACLECVNCPCFGHCESKATCSADTDCGVGEVCGTDSMNCTMHCLVGCHDDGDCRADQFCPPMPPCMGCGCDHTTCQARPVGCTDDAQCGPGRICAYDNTFSCAGERHCQEGCLKDSDCVGGAVCMLADCGPCCPGWCVQPPGCQSDDQCPPGEVCEPGPGCGGQKSCVAGCRVGTKPCLNGQTCTEVDCLTCPCPGRCAGSPTCSMNEPVCSTTLDCSWGASHCADGCCTYCPVYDVAPCPDGQCMYGNGVDGNGCANGPLCASCCACPAITDPVCGTNYQTYQSSCEATCAGATVLHDGECKPFEGMDCWQGTCATGQYCRDACPVCDMSIFRCTMVGACTADWDCPAGATSGTPGCANPIWKCEANHTCSYTCP